MHPERCRRRAAAAPVRWRTRPGPRSRARRREGPVRRLVGGTRCVARARPGVVDAAPPRPGQPERSYTSEVMTERSFFTDDEWAALSEAPLHVTSAMIAVAE